MKIRKLFVAVLAALVSMLGMAETATVDGLLWQYSVSDGKATVEKLLTPGVENVVIPGEINGCKVVTIGEKAFYQNENIRTVVIPEGVTVVGGQAFLECVNLLDAKLPSTLKRIENSAFCDSYLRRICLPFGLEYLGLSALNMRSRSCSHIIVEGSSLNIASTAFGADDSFNLVVEFLDRVPQGLCNTRLCNMSTFRETWISYPRKYADEWMAVVPQQRFAGYVPENPCKVSVISKMRENAPTIMDVKVTPVSTKSEVKIRPVAFLNGVISFANVVKVKTFAEGTETVVQNPVKANQESVFSWNVAADLTDKVAKLKMDVMCIEEDVIQLEFVTIPASSGHLAMTISRNVIAPTRICDALLWLMADKTKDVKVRVTESDGTGNGLRKVDFSVEKDERKIDGWFTYVNDIQLKKAYEGGYDLNFGTSVTVKKFVLEELGYTILEGDDLEYARKMTGLKLENGPYVKMK